ncbi:hypothetical protein SAMCFNEI73_Ch0608 [Sinorhizobium americanum]|uniref:Uncharacterized protein n=2 Tax=Sinorhizobium americanum TaxID=194963 RepID=A0A1L3LIJ8_9HYPH|nr:hypothetical protein SAMCCGM7_Ch0613 [Sinorhizobium americanum CCGM7]APG89934.1 hypothetical protein SAMCFNEI73_Ch0608 [Sinorhizobium americanum]OAP47233.1 hypothetical protein ATC00_14225 [Sinorhizobium americanum]
MAELAEDVSGGKRGIIAVACFHVGAAVAPDKVRATLDRWPATEGNYDEENPVRIEGGRIKAPIGPARASKRASPIMSSG